MGRTEKALTRLLSVPRNYSYKELKMMLASYGYKEYYRGKTSGSRVTLISEKSNHIIKLHKPHNSQSLKEYQIKQIISGLRKTGVLK